MRPPQTLLDIFWRVLCKRNTVTYLLNRSLSDFESSQVAFQRTQKLKSRGKVQLKNRCQKENCSLTFRTKYKTFTFARFFDVSTNKEFTHTQGLHCDPFCLPLETTSRSLHFSNQETLDQPEQVGRLFQPRRKDYQGLSWTTKVSGHALRKAPAC